MPVEYQRIGLNKMNEPTDKQILNHMRQEDDYCGKCHGDVERVEDDDYITYRCLVCGYEPLPAGEE